jgi:hypothetical protein
VKSYYAIVNVEGRQLGGYVCAENLAAAFEAATLQYKKRYPRFYVETIAVQEMTDACSSSAAPGNDGGRLRHSLRDVLEGPRQVEERMTVQGPGRAKDLDQPLERQVLTSENGEVSAAPPVQKPTIADSTFEIQQIYGAAPAFCLVDL